MDNIDGFTPIVAIFYAVFHPTEGTKIIHQVPEGSISSTKDDDLDSMSLFNFDTVKNYIIPKPQLCNKLISFKIDKFRVMGYPVNIQNADYSRNSFNFNFCFVFPYDSEVTPYEPAITRMGKMFRVLEEQSFMLSKLDKDYSFFKNRDVIITPPTQKNSFVFGDNDQMINTPGHSKTKKITLTSIDSLIYQIFQDLNNYSECCIPLDSANSVDIKLFPLLLPPLDIKKYQVPIAKVNLKRLVDVNWDPTMVKILPYIDGINSVKKISELADSDYLLTKQCIQHLMHYKCIEILGLFQFSNIYAPTNHIDNFLLITGMAEECQAYIVTGNQTRNLADLPLAAKSGFQNSPTSSVLNNSVSPLSRSSYLTASKLKSSDERTSIRVPSKTTLFYLYRFMNQSQTVKEWYIQHRRHLANIDIRRFVDFGMRRGLIYRVYSYPILNSITRSIESGQAHSLDNIIKQAKNKAHGETEQQNRRSLLRNSTNESNLVKTKRKVSFNYNVTSRRVNLAKELAIDSDVEEEYDEYDSDNLNSDKSDIDDDFDIMEEKNDEELIKLVSLLKEFRHFDSICTELLKSRLEIEEILDKLGSYSVING